LHYPLEQLRSYFSNDIRGRILGTTALQRSSSNDVGQRQREAELYLRENNLGGTKWIAIDDTPTNYLPGADVVLCNDMFGESEEIALRKLLAEIYANTSKSDRLCR
jgi:HAD domain in Swiss Army Knife RNA repair proteins